MLFALCLCLFAYGAAADHENVVGVLSGMGGYQQIVTSSTLRWLTTQDGKVPKHAVEGAQEKFHDEETDEDVVNKVWVCRARAQSNNMWMAGVLTKEPNGNGKCMGLHNGRVQPFSSFEILQNIEDGGRLSWMPWDKLHTPPGGSVTVSTDTTLFVGRRKATDPHSKVDYHLGRIEGGLMGRIVVLENGEEKTYDDGEVLVETEPLRYEMTNVKFNRFRARAQREPLTLGHTVMRNEDEPTADSDVQVSRVDTVIAYKHNQTISWGQGHAILSGLPVIVLHANGTKMDEFTWALDTFHNNLSSIYQVETFLAAGRGVNVTLVGNWTEANMPYTSKIIAIYKDGYKKSRMISGTKREVGMMDVHPEFGPVYYLHNNTHVPTTTTTTTSTTTTTTTTRTTSVTTTEEAKPIPIPMEELNSTTKKGVVNSANPKENQSWPNDAPKQESVESKSGGSVLKVLTTPVLLISVVLFALFT